MAVIKKNSNVKTALPNYSVKELIAAFVAISNGGQCPQLNSGLGTSHGWLSSMWIERSDTLIHALGYNTTMFAGQSEGSYVLILVPKKLEDFETFNAVLQRGAGDPSLACQLLQGCPQTPV